MNDRRGTGENDREGTSGILLPTPLSVPPPPLCHFRRTPFVLPAVFPSVIPDISPSVIPASFNRESRSKAPHVRHPSPRPSPSRGEGGSPAQGERKAGGMRCRPTCHSERSEESHVRE